MQGPDLLDDIAEELEFAREAVNAASALALDHWKRGPRSWHKEDGSPVSEADLAVDRLLHQSLLIGRPDYGWLSEETPDESRRLSATHLWIADPIDGTREFLAGGMDWCIALALVTKGKPVLAVVSCPARDEVFTALIGEGAMRNDERLKVIDRARLKDAAIVANKSALARLGKSMGAAPRLPLSLRLCRVAENRSDAVLAITPKHDWDLAAGDLIVREAGGRVSAADGSAYVFNRRNPRQAGLIAAAPTLHQEIVDALRME